MILKAGLKDQHDLENNSGIGTDIRGFMKNKVKILVVEDETAVAMMMVFLLTQAGCDAEAAWNVEKAITLAQNRDFDLVTLDIDFGNSSGFEILARLRQIPRYQNTPAVFVSGGPSEENRQRAFEVGAVDYISKPFGLEFAPRVLSHVENQKASKVTGVNL